MKTVATVPNRETGIAAKMQEFLVFKLGTEEYAIDILKVQEIRGYAGVTRIANTPPFIKGVFNLRGLIVPVIDMRIKFGLGEPAYDELTVLIVLNIGKRAIGIVVDAVSDVVGLAGEAMHPPPGINTVGAQFLAGMATLDSRLLILMDIEKLMTSPEMELVEQVAA